MYQQDLYKSPMIGDVYYAELNGECSVQNGVRPVVIFQNNVGNKFSPNVAVLPITSKIKKSTMPTHVVIKASQSGLAKDSMVLCENPVCLPKSKLGNYVTTLSKNSMSKIAEANIMASAAISFVDPSLLLDIWTKASRLNSVAAL